MKSLTLIMGTMSLLPLVIAECCRISYNTGRCKDNTGGTPCCGYGKCDLFCCKCIDGCRTSGISPFRGLSKRSDSTEGAFIEADTDGTGNLTLDQYLEYMSVGEDTDIWVKWFKTYVIYFLGSGGRSFSFLVRICANVEPQKARRE
jgi:hypothetical protein